MITIHNNNYDITAAETQTTSKLNFIEYINFDYVPAARAPDRSIVLPLWR